jgi:signal transduction histidine kinase
VRDPGSHRRARRGPDAIGVGGAGGWCVVAPARRSALALVAGVVAALCSAPAAAAEPVPLAITSTTVHPDLAIVHLKDGWVRAIGDDARWAAPDHDDAAWAPAPLTRGIIDMQLLGAHDVAWFRLALQVPAHLAGVDLELYLTWSAAIELFVDGRSVGRFGARADDTEPAAVSFAGRHLPIRFDAPGRHVLAVRLDPRRDGLAQWMDPRPAFGLSIADRPGVAEHRRRAQHLERICYAFAAAALALGALHLFLFLFRREQRVHLYYAASSFSIATVALTSYGTGNLETLTGAITFVYVNRVAILCTGVSGLLFYYSAFKYAIPRYFWIFLAVGAGFALSAPFISIAWILVFTAAALVEELRVLVHANLRRVDGAWIVLIGGGASIFTGLVQVLAILQVVPSTWVPPFFYLYGFLALLLSMSIYLARNVAGMERVLAAQLARVQELSELAVAQERRAQEEQTARLLLEADNLRQEDLLEEAKKRERVLQQLSNAHGELAKAHDELRQTQSKLAQSERMASLGQLVAGIAHEINTPVGAMASAQDSLRRATVKLKDALAAEVRDDAKLARLLSVIDDANRVMESGSVRVTNIVRRLKTFARLDEAELKRVDLHEGLDDTLMLLDHELRGRVEVTKEYGTLPLVACYPGQINQVFLNLIHNARQAIPVRGRLTITTWAEADRVKVRVRDDGVGIPPENLRKIFDPGFTTKGVRVGTGLGLAICYRIIEEHHGEITVESKPGEGSTFTVAIPLDLDDILAERRKTGLTIPPP